MRRAPAASVVAATLAACLLAGARHAEAQTLPNNGDGNGDGDGIGNGIQWEEIEVQSTPFAELACLNRSFPGVTFAGGFVLASGDARFGGWSGLVTHAQKEGSPSPSQLSLTAVSDVGYWLGMDLGATGVSNCSISPLLDTRGAPLIDRHKLWSDAESVVEVAAGGAGERAFLVSFEEEDRIWLYRDAGSPARSDAPILSLASEILRENCGFNAGAEGIEVLQGDGGLLMFCEDALASHADVFPGWVISVANGRQGFKVVALFLKVTDGYRPTDLATLGNGDVAVLERMYDGTHLGMRLEVIPRDRLAPPPATVTRPARVLEATKCGRGANHVDNMEGLAVHYDEATQVLRILAISDDNFNKPVQETVLLDFEVSDVPSLEEYVRRTAGTEALGRGDATLAGMSIAVAVCVMLAVGAALGSALVLIVLRVEAKRKAEAYRWVQLSTCTAIDDADEEA